MRRLTLRASASAAGRDYISLTAIKGLLTHATDCGRIAPGGRRGKIGHSSSILSIKAAAVASPRAIACRRAAAATITNNKKVT